MPQPTVTEIILIGERRLHFQVNGYQEQRTEGYIPTLHRKYGHLTQK